MPHPSKRKGNRFERALVNAARNAGLDAERAYASNGRSLGHAEAVDLTIGPWRIQAKRRKSVANYLQPPDGCDVVAIREDRGDPLVVLPYAAFLQLIQPVSGHATTVTQTHA